jgi:hypothetical protein
MNLLLCEKDYKFYSYQIEQKAEPSSILLMTNNENIISTNSNIFEEPTFDEFKKKITHFKRRFYQHTKEIYCDFPFITYFHCQYSLKMFKDKINFSNFVNLETIVLGSCNIDDKTLVNLPNIKTLVFLILSVLDCSYLNFEFSNLPLTLEQIIFKYFSSYGDKKTNKFLINMINQKLMSKKIPFNCKILFVDDVDIIQLNI